jgi:hypothetical protein
MGCQLNAQPPTWKTLLVWNLTLNLSGLGVPASSYATAGIALETYSSAAVKSSVREWGGCSTTLHTFCTTFVRSISFKISDNC